MGRNSTGLGTSWESALTLGFFCLRACLCIVRRGLLISSEVTTRADLQFWQSQKLPRVWECQERGRRSEETKEKTVEAKGSRVMSGGGVKKRATTAEHSPPQFHSSGTHVSLFAHRRAFVILERALPRQSRKHPRVRSSQRMEMWRGVFLRTTHLSCKG